MIREMEVELSGQARTFLQWEDTVPGDTFSVETFIEKKIVQSMSKAKETQCQVTLSGFIALVAKHCRT